MSAFGVKRTVQICLSLRVMRVLLGSLGFLCLEVVLNCELKHPGARCRVAEQITSCTTVLGAGAVVLAKSDRFGFCHHRIAHKKDRAVLLPQESTARSSVVPNGLPERFTPTVPQ